MKYSRQELKQKLREVKQKWQDSIQYKTSIKNQTLIKITGGYGGRVNTLNDHPIYCSHDHCRFWQRKTYSYFLKPKNRTNSQKEEDEED